MATFKVMMPVFVRTTSYSKAAKIVLDSLNLSEPQGSPEVDDQIEVINLTTGEPMMLETSRIDELAAGDRS